MEAAVDLGWTLHKSSTLKKKCNFQIFSGENFLQKENDKFESWHQHSIDIQELQYNNGMKNLPYSQSKILHLVFSLENWDLDYAGAMVTDQDYGHS